MRAISTSGFRRRPRSWRGGLASHRSSDTVSVFQPLALSRSERPDFARSRARAVGDFPDVLDLTHRSHPVPVASAASKLFSPRESARTTSRFRSRAMADALLGFRLSRALIRSSLGPSHDPADHSVRRGLVTAVAKGATPRRQVRPDDLAAAATSSASGLQGYCRPARATSRWQSCLPRPWSHRLPGGSWSSEV